MDSADQARRIPRSAGDTAAAEALVADLDLQDFGDIVNSPSLKQYSPPQRQRTNAKDRPANSAGRYGRHQGHEVRSGLRTMRAQRNDQPAQDQPSLTKIVLRWLTDEL